MCDIKLQAWDPNIEKDAKLITCHVNFSEFTLLALTCSNKARSRASRRRRPTADSSQHRASCSRTMNILLCELLLLSLFSSVSCGCQKDCLTCKEKLRPALDSFNLEVCILECEGKVFSRPLWTPCTQVLARGSWQLSPADPEHVVAALYQPRASEMQLKRMPRIRSLFQAQKGTEPGMEEAGETEQKQLQKRFGGFTGARKSARKLANQKRFTVPSTSTQECLGDPPNSMSPAPDLPAGKRGSFCPKALRQASPPGLHPRGTAHLGPSPHGMFHDDPVATSECIFVIPPADM
ncbi:Prepronociceptin [Manis javanica]|nr:Prepronociceptin [Manis javanica]